MEGNIMEKSPWDSDFGSIFKQRYTRDMLDKYDRDIRKDIVGDAVAAGITNTIVPGSGIVGAVANEALNQPKGQKAEETNSGTPVSPEDAAGAAKAAAPEDAESAALALSQDGETVEPRKEESEDVRMALRKAQTSLNRFLKNCAPNAGLNVKKVTQSKGKAYPQKPAPKPKKKNK